MTFHRSLLLAHLHINHCSMCMCVGRGCRVPKVSTGTSQLSAGGPARAQDQDAVVARKKRRTTTRTQARSIVGASLEVLFHPHYR